MMFHVYQDARNQWRWHLRSLVGSQLADVGAGYARRNEGWGRWSNSYTP